MLASIGHLDLLESDKFVQKACVTLRLGKTKRLAKTRTLHVVLIANFLHAWSIMEESSTGFHKFVVLLAWFYVPPTPGFRSLLDPFVALSNPWVVG